MTHLLPTFHDAVHVLGRVDGKLVTHALWVTRWLQSGDKSLWCTAFVEAVATDHAYRRRGYASAVMRRITEEIKDYDIGGLCTGGSQHLYQTVGWQLWQGPLSIRLKDGTFMPTPDEHGVMVLTLPKTPPFNLASPLSAEWREGELW
ncbi:MAG: GNAT family N-acetyltransferase [Dehalococcoidales bacterium]|nr:GNAT family N-acetyltransferase [Dehalococcoidales bacterium]